MDVTPEEELHERRRNCEILIRLMARGLLIPFLGAGVNLADRPSDFVYEPEGEYLPSGTELSDLIASKFKYPSDWEDKKLTRVAWHAGATEGKDVLDNYLSSIFSRDYRSTDVHHFFARLPGRLAEKGYTNKHQIIVTTNYDELLELAFDAQKEPYDVFTYVVHNNAGKFRYTPHGGSPTFLQKPNEFILPTGKTIILKIHGAVDRVDWENSSFVITEDDYIEYLALLNPKDIPSAITQKMLRRRFLFLGYSLSDWNLRVLLRNIRERNKYKRRPLAIMDKHKDWDPLYWEDQGVDLIKRPLKDYIETLNEELEKLPPNRFGV